MSGNNNLVGRSHRIQYLNTVIVPYYVMWSWEVSEANREWPWCYSYSLWSASSLFLAQSRQAEAWFKWEKISSQNFCQKVTIKNSRYQQCPFQIQLKGGLIFDWIRFQLPKVQVREIDEGGEAKVKVRFMGLGHARKHDARWGGALPSYPTKCQKKSILLLSSLG